MKLVEDNLNQTTCQLIRPTVQQPEFQCRHTKAIKTP